jgi:hypothetical protein
VNYNRLSGQLKKERKKERQKGRKKERKKDRKKERKKKENLTLLQETQLVHFAKGNFLKGNGMNFTKEVHILNYILKCKSSCYN